MMGDDTGGGRLRALRARLTALAGDDLLRRLAAGGSAALAIRIVGAMLSLAMLAGLARAMSAAEYGRFTVGYSLAMVLSAICSLGLHNGILRWRPEHDVRGSIDFAHAAERWGYNMTLLAALVALALGGVAGALTSRVGAGTLATLDGVGVAGACALAAVLAISLYHANAARARGSIVAALLPREVLWRAAVAVFAGAVLLGVAKEPTATEALWTTTGLLLALTVLQTFATGVRPGLHGRYDAGIPMLGLRGPARFLMRQAGPMWGVAVLQSVARYIEVVVIGFFVLPEVTAVYFATLTVAHSLLIILLGLNAVVGPLIARTHYAGDRASLQRMMRLLMLGITGPVLAAAGLLAVFSQTVLGLFDPSFAEGWPLLLLLLTGTTFISLAGPTALLLQLAGEERAYLKLLTSVTIGVTLIQIVTLPLFGIWAAAVANVAGQIVLNVGARRIAVRRIGVDPSLLCLFRRPPPAPPADP